MKKKKESASMAFVESSLLVAYQNEIDQIFKNQEAMGEPRFHIEPQRAQVFNGEVNGILRSPVAYENHYLKSLKSLYEDAPKPKSKNKKLNLPEWF